jgi:hypothetical protein
VKLDYHIVKSIVNAFFGLFVGRRTRATFFKVPETYPELDHVTRAYPAIRREFDRLLAEWNDLPQYHDVDPGERAISATTPKRWNVFLLEIMGHRPAENRASLPGDVPGDRASAQHDPGLLLDSGARQIGAGA